MMATISPCRGKDGHRCPSRRPTCAWCAPSPSPKK